MAQPTEPPPFHASEELVFKASRITSLTNETTVSIGDIYCTNYRLAFSGSLIQSDNSP